MSLLYKDYKTIELDLIDVTTQILDLYFHINDENTSDFYIKITKRKEEIDLNDFEILLYVMKPNKVVKNKELEYDSTTKLVYCNLEDELKNLKGAYVAQIALKDKNTGERIFTRSTFCYYVGKDILAKLDESIIEENSKILQDIIKRIDVLENKQVEIDLSDYYKKQEIDDKVADYITKNDVKNADWNQNDETKLDYIKNRPFYEEIKEIVICEDQKLSQISSDGRMCMGELEVLNYPKWNYDFEYIKATLIINGKSVELSPQNNSPIYFGNGAPYGGEDNQEEFAIIIFDNIDNYYCNLLWVNGKATECTISLIATMKYYHQIPSKYIRNTNVYGEYINANGEYSYTEIPYLWLPLLQYDTDFSLENGILQIGCPYGMVNSDGVPNSSIEGIFGFNAYITTDEVQNSVNIEDLSSITEHIEIILGKQNIYYDYSVTGHILFIKIFDKKNKIFYPVQLFVPFQQGKWAYKGTGCFVDFEGNTYTVLYNQTEEGRKAEVIIKKNNKIDEIDASMITQDATHRFVTDEEKNNWNDNIVKYINPSTFEEFYNLICDKNGLYIIEDGFECELEDGTVYIYGLIEVSKDDYIIYCNCFDTGELVTIRIEDKQLGGVRDKFDYLRRSALYGGTTDQVLTKISGTDGHYGWSDIPQLVTHITPPDNYETSDKIALYNMLPVDSIVVFDNDYWITDNIRISSICYVTSWIFENVEVKTISILEAGQYVMLKPDGTIHNSGFNAPDLADFFAIINNENRKEGQVLKVGNGGYYYEWGDIPQLAFNEDGELVVTIDGVSKTFVAKE